MYYNVVFHSSTNTSCFYSYGCCRCQYFDTWMSPLPRMIETSWFGVEFWTFFAPKLNLVCCMILDVVINYCEDVLQGHKLCAITAWCHWQQWLYKWPGISSMLRYQWLKLNINDIWLLSANLWTIHGLNPKHCDCSCFICDRSIVTCDRDVVTCDRILYVSPLCYVSRIWSLDMRFTQPYGWLGHLKQGWKNQSCSILP